MTASTSPQVLALIPARGGSKGVPRKNIAPLQGHPLIAYSIVASQRCPGIHRTLVSTDCPEIAEIAKAYGADVPFLRPAELAVDSSPDRDFIDHALIWLEAHENYRPDFIVHLRPTTPLRDPTVLERAIDQMKSSSDASSLRSAHAAPETPLKWFLRTPGGFFQPLLPTMTLEDTNRPRQSFPTVYIPNGYVDILRVSFLKKGISLHGEQMAGFITPFVTEVDTREDFQYLEFELEKTPSVLSKFLNDRHKG